ncbi:hypothetical protein, partial [Komagataeibacter kakiaceti]
CPPVWPAVAGRGRNPRKKDLEMAQNRIAPPSRPAVEIAKFVAIVLLWTASMVTFLLLPDVFLDPCTGIIDLR